MEICWGPELISDYPFLPTAIVSQVEINSRPSKLSRFFKGIGLDDAASPLAANTEEKKCAAPEKSVILKAGAKQGNAPPSWDRRQFGSNIFGGEV